jgi:hypothetical protein
MVKRINQLRGSKWPRLNKSQMSLNSILCIRNILSYGYHLVNGTSSGPKRSHKAASTDCITDIIFAVIVPVPHHSQTEIKLPLSERVAEFNTFPNSSRVVEGQFLEMPDNGYGGKQTIINRLSWKKQLNLFVNELKCSNPIRSNNAW